MKVSGCWKKHPDAVKEYPDALKGHPDAFIFQLQNDEQNAGKLFKINSNYHHSMETWEKQVPMNQGTTL